MLCQPFIPTGCQTKEQVLFVVGFRHSRENAEHYRQNWYGLWNTNNLCQRKPFNYHLKQKFIFNLEIKSQAPQRP